MIEIRYGGRLHVWTCIGNAIRQNVGGTFFTKMCPTVRKKSQISNRHYPVVTNQVVPVIFDKFSGPPRVSSRFSHCFVVDESIQMGESNIEKAWAN